MTTEATQTDADGGSLEDAFEAAFANDGTQTGAQSDQQRAQTGQGDQVSSNQNATESDPDADLVFDEDGNNANPEEIDPDETGPVELADGTEIKLVIDGKEVVKTFAEIRAEAQKYEAANKRFEEAAEVRKISEANIAQAQAREAQAANVLKHYVEQYNQLLAETQPNWEQLLAQDPAAYVRIKHSWEQRQAKLQAAQRDQQELLRQQQERDAASAQARVAEQIKTLHTAIPEWKDPVKAAEGAKQIDAYLDSQGIPPHMRGQIDTASVILIVRKAMAYDSAIAKRAAAKMAAGAQGGQQQSPQARQQQSRTVRPGSAQRPQPQQLRDAQARTRQAKGHEANPTVDSLATFFEE